MFMARCMDWRNEFVPLYGVDQVFIDTGYKINTSGLIIKPDGKFLYGFSNHKAFHASGKANPKHGYKSVTLYSGDYRKNYYIHRLVYMAFHRIKLRDDEDVHHINKNKSDNRPYNLRKMTRQEHALLTRKERQK